MRMMKTSPRETLSSDVTGYRKHKVTRSGIYMYLGVAFLMLIGDVTASSSAVSSSNESAPAPLKKILAEADKKVSKPANIWEQLRSLRKLRGVPVLSVGELRESARRVRKRKEAAAAAGVTAEHVEEKQSEPTSMNRDGSLSRLSLSQKPQPDVAAPSPTRSVRTDAIQARNFSRTSEKAPKAEENEKREFDRSEYEKFDLCESSDNHWSLGLEEFLGEQLNDVEFDDSEDSEDRKKKRTTAKCLGAISLGATIGFVSAGVLDAIASDSLLHHDFWQTLAHFMANYWFVWSPGLVLALFFATMSTPGHSRIPLIAVAIVWTATASSVVVSATYIGTNPTWASFAPVCIAVAALMSATFLMTIGFACHKHNFNIRKCWGCDK